ncbi:MAG TPA: Rpn family recombination-promoting nuclease/putative transposase [Thermoanaerobaculia bacterium]|nr:Rpn family recombination-promoting nuclease/putative transposase [Thermoanaerobaculia bacterium]
MRPIFADPKTDFVFKRIFGSEVHKPLLIELLNALLELEGDHRIADLKYLSPEQHVPVEELKLSVVDVKCFDERGRHYVVEMQVLNVEGFEKRVVYNTSKAYVMQLRSGDDYPGLDDVVGVTICDFLLWPEPPVASGEPVPMLSRWRMQEQHGGAVGLSQVQYVFLELPKYVAGDAPEGTIDRWAYFFREAKNLEVVPPALAVPPYREALEVARMAGFSAGELDLYESAKMAEQDARGILTLAERLGREAGLAKGRAEGREEGRAEGRTEGRAEGLEEGRAEGLREAIRVLCQAFEIEIDAEREALLASLEAGELKELQARLLRDRRWS